jgi:glycerol-3-phosphate acyltransferase PlsX
MIRIAVDAMGGDNAPDEIVLGAVEAANCNIAEILLVGKTNEIKNIFKKNSIIVPENISLHHAEEFIEMGESPAAAVRRKKNSSILLAHKLVNEGIADGVVSAGSTGAQMAAALMTFGRIKNIIRPAIVAVLPTLSGPKIILDVGANLDCKPENFLQFAQMGSIYANKILKCHSPRVGLINIGVEENKGNALTQESFKILNKNLHNFVGNIETRDLPEGNVEVAVCDGFVGNCLLKFGEGLAKNLFDMIKKQLQKNVITKTASLALLPGFHEIKKQMNHEEYGGAPLLGIKGVSIICHGSSKSYAVKNGIKVAVQCIENDLVSLISSIDELDTGRDMND